MSNKILNLLGKFVLVSNVPALVIDERGNNVLIRRAADTAIIHKDFLTEISSTSNLQLYRQLIEAELNFAIEHQLVSRIFFWENKLKEINQH